MYIFSNAKFCTTQQTLINIACCILICLLCCRI